MNYEATYFFITWDWTENAMIQSVESKHAMSNLLIRLLKPRSTSWSKENCTQQDRSRKGNFKKHTREKARSECDIIDLFRIDEWTWYQKHMTSDVMQLCNVMGWKLKHGALIALQIQVESLFLLSAYEHTLNRVWRSQAVCLAIPCDPHTDGVGYPDIGFSTKLLNLSTFKSSSSSSSIGVVWASTTRSASSVSLCNSLI